MRAAEKLVADHFSKQGVVRTGRAGSSSAASKTLAPAIQHLQNRLQQHLATHVSLHHNDKRGRIEIEYYGNDDLNRILGVIGLKPDET